MSAQGSSPTSPDDTPEVATLDLLRSPFNSRTVTITVGHARVRFSIHEAMLAKTGFFNVHEPLPTREDRGIIRRSSTIAGSPQNVAETPQPIVHGLDDVGIKVETPTHTASEMQTPIDYHLEDQFFFKPKAFNVFVSHLYNKPPTVPRTHSQVKTLFQTYGIAIRYDCYQLQNNVTDCLRQYYAQTSIRLDDLLWAVNRFGDSIECPLNAYLVEQVAFEITDQGLLRFTANNQYFATFLEEGDRVIRHSLFAALVRHAETTTKQDPASGRMKYHVHETGVRAGKLKQ